MHDPDTPPLMLGLFFVALQSHWGKHTAYKATNAAKNNKNETAIQGTKLYTSYFIFNCIFNSLIVFMAYPMYLQL